MREPQEIEDRQHEQAVARVAAVDVAKASAVVCTRVPRAGGPGRFVTKVWPVGCGKPPPTAAMTLINRDYHPGRSL
jgi:hypothetical protein